MCAERGDTTPRRWTSLCLLAGHGVGMTVGYHVVGRIRIAQHNVESFQVALFAQIETRASLGLRT